MQVTDATAKGSWFSFLHRYIGSNNVNTQYKMTKSNVTGLRFSKVEYQYDFSETRTAMGVPSWLVFPPHMARHFEAYDARSTQEQLNLPLVNPNQTIYNLAIFRVRPVSIKINPWLQSSSF